ncbi:MAG: metallophosphoesterase family protein [Akkermansiaceae bacterium]
MRYAIFSDIHANLRAWESVFTDMRAQRVDVLICLGDVVGYGPKPMEVLDSIRSVTSNFVMGNHDAAAIGAMDYSVFNDHARQSTEWTAAALTEEAKEFLSSVPLAIESEDLLFVHAEICDPKRFDYITDIDSAEVNFAASKHFLTFVGHTHHPKVFELNSGGQVLEHPDGNCILNASSRYIVNVGSVGEPRTPEDLRARYVVYDSESREVDFRAVQFDMRACRQDLDSTTLQVTSFYLQAFEAENGAPEKDWVARNEMAQVSSGNWLHSANPTATVSLKTNQQKSIWRRILPAAAALLVFAIPAAWFGKQWFAPSKVAIEIASSESTDLLSPKNEKLEEPSKKTSEPGKNTPVKPTPEIVIVEPSVAKPADPAVAVLQPEKALPSPNKPAVIPQSAKAPEPVPKPPAPEERVVAWWRMETPEEGLHDSKNRHSLNEVSKGSTFKPLGPARLPTTGVENEGGMKLGVWVEAEPSGDFALRADRSFTLETWLLSDRVSSPVFLAGTRSGELNEQQGWHIDLRPPGGSVRRGQMSFFWDSGPAMTQALSEDLNVTDLKPHHIAAVWQHDYSKDMGEMRLYLDSEQIASTTVPHSQIPGTQVNPFRIGAVGNPERLAMDEVRFSRAALDPLEFLGAAPQSMSKNGDWLEKTNWTSGKLPSGEQTAVIGPGVKAAAAKAVPAFTGDLVLRKNASLHVSDAGIGAIPKAPARLIFKEGSKLVVGSGQNLQSFGPIVLDGKAEIWGGVSTQGHHTTRLLEGEVTGDQGLALIGVNNNIFRLAAKNSFTGGFLAESTQNQGFRVQAEESGCFSNGSVKIGTHATLILIAEDTIDDRARLDLSGPHDRRSKAKLILNVNETVGQLRIDDVPQKPGTWGPPGSSATHKSESIAGKGILTVLK